MRKGISYLEVREHLGKGLYSEVQLAVSGKCDGLEFLDRPELELNHQRFLLVAPAQPPVSFVC